MTWKITPDERFKGDPTESLGQFLAKWLELLRPHMNDSDREEFTRDLKRALRSRERKLLALGRRKATGL